MWSIPPAWSTDIYEPYKGPNFYSVCLYEPGQSETTQGPRKERGDGDEIMRDGS